jgi:uncharacterized membrane-anchored protein
MFGSAPLLNELWFLAVQTLSLILRRDRYYFTVYSALGTFAISIVLIGLFLLLARRWGPDWALTTSLLCAMAVPIVLSVVYALRIILLP